MASSGTINGNRSGYKPYLRINWNIDQTDISGNRTRLRLRLYLIHPYPVYYSATKSGKLQGSSFSSTTNVNGTGNTLLQTRYIWVGHNSDGTKTQSLNASFNIAITFDGRSLSSLSVSGNAVLNRIPRKTDLTSASIASLQASKSATLSIGRDVKYSGFYHLVTIMDGSTWIWDDGHKSGSPSTSYTLPSSTVNKMLNRMKNVTSKTFRVRIKTYTGSGGSGYIGESVRNVTVSVHSSVKPNIDETSVEQVGNQWAISKGIYVQSESGVRAEFRSSASGGAGVGSRNIRIGNTNGGRVVDSVFRHQINTLNDTGNITITYTITDTRGRSTSSSRTISITPYSPPKITSFTATRKESAPTTVTVRREGTHTSLDSANSASMLIERKSGTGGWTTVKENSSSGGTWGSTATSTGNSVTSSYDFRATLTDSLGNIATATVTVSTQRVVLDVHKNEGVGIGKIHEKGTLDVDGSAFFTGSLRLFPQTTRPSFRLYSPDPNGHGYVEYYGNDNVRKGYIGFYSANSNNFQIKNEQGGNVDLRTEGSGKATVNGAPIMSDSGTFTGGAWVKFADGTAIAWKEDAKVTYTRATVLDYRWNLPIQMLATPRPATMITKNEYTGAGAIRDATMGGYANESGGRTTYVDVLMMAGGGTTFNSGYSSGVRIMVIGRWK